jgi:hypothetical protein
VEPPSSFDDSNIYDNSDDDSLAPPPSSILPSESASQVPLRVPRIQAISRIRSPVFKHYSTTLLNEYYISRKTKKRTQDRQHKCKQCLYTTLDSRRDGTTNMIKHLEKHAVFLSQSVISSQQPTIDAMFQRLINTQLSTRMMSLEQAILEWIIDTLQPFVVVEHPSFRRMFECMQQLLPLRSGDVVHSRIMSQLNNSILSLTEELELASSISLSLDAWTSPNHIPVFAIIGHWITPNYVKHEALFEFTALKGVHSGENMAGITFESLEGLRISRKLLALTADNALNNNTLVEHLHRRLLTQFDDEVDPELSNIKPVMQFWSKQHRIRCIAHILNLIVSQILSSLKTGTAKEARDFDETQVKSIGPLNGVVKIRLIVLWIFKSTQRQES